LMQIMSGVPRCLAGELEAALLARFLLNRYIWNEQTPREMGSAIAFLENPFISPAYQNNDGVPLTLFARPRRSNRDDRRIPSAESGLGRRQLEDHLPRLRGLCPRNLPTATATVLNRSFSAG